MIKKFTVKNLLSFKNQISIYLQSILPLGFDAWDQVEVCSTAKSPALTRRKELMKRALGSANLTILVHN